MKCQHCKGPIEECGGKTFKNSYACSECGMYWEDTWCCACNDHCPVCHAETEPEYHPDTDDHRAGCTHCQYVYDSKLPDGEL
jgi:hypothetical protein